ncbi:J domain-containing protein [Leptolyngbya sp. FACHB-16]|nr:J domain-containing protein [Leptolyngbya sp. FACHB-16]
MLSVIDGKIQELVNQYGYDEQILRELVELVQSQAKPSAKKKELTKSELELAVAAVFGCKNAKELKKDGSFQQVIAGRDLNLSRKDSWLTLYREWVETEATPPPPPPPPPPSPPKPTELKKAELETAVAAAFNCKDIRELKKNEAFKLAIAGRDLNLSRKDSWLVLYREWVGVPENERNEEGPHCINGIDVLKNFRPWHVFNLDPKTATSDDINKAFRQLAKEHHPDHGGDRDVFERLQKMRDSILAFR